LRVARSHGIDIPSVTMETADRYLDHVSVHYSGRNDIDDVSNCENGWNQVAVFTHLHIRLSF